MSTCSAIGAIECGDDKLSLQDVTSVDAGFTVQHSRVLDMVQDAFGSALSPPKANTGDSYELVSGTTGSGGSFSEAGGDLVSPGSNVASSGSMSRTSDEDQRHSDRVVEMVNNSTLKIASYQLAWQIADRIQKDISHIMKG